MIVPSIRVGAFLWLLRPGERDLTVKGVTVRAVDAISALK
jgi:hypothetical protein